MWTMWRYRWPEAGDQQSLSALWISASLHSAASQDREVITNEAALTPCSIRNLCVCVCVVQCVVYRSIVVSIFINEYKFGNLIVGRSFSLLRAENVGTPLRLEPQELPERRPPGDQTGWRYHC